MKVMDVGLPASQVLVGSRAEQMRGLLRLNYPISHGVVRDWEAMDKIWHYVFEELKTEAKEVFRCGIFARGLTPSRSTPSC